MGSESTFDAHRLTRLLLSSYAWTISPWSGVASSYASAPTAEFTNGLGYYRGWLTFNFAQHKTKPDLSSRSCRMVHLYLHHVHRFLEIIGRSGLCLFLPYHHFLVAHAWRIFPINPCATPSWRSFRYHHCVLSLVYCSCRITSTRYLSLCLTDWTSDPRLKAQLRSDTIRGTEIF